MNYRLLALAATSLIAATASAQSCSDNVHPIHIVDAAGDAVPIGFDPVLNGNVPLVPTEEVFMAFDPTMPTGTYYVHVTDAKFDGMDEVVSENDPMDRFVHIENNAGTITLTFPFSANPANITLGAGLNGVGQSLGLNPFRASEFTQCRFKAWCGDVWNLANGPEWPYIVRGGLNPNTGGCAVRSYKQFVVGDGSGSDIKGLVFDDLNENGSQDAGEAGLAGWTVSLNDGAATVSVTTDAAGNYCFEDAGAGSFTIAVTEQAGFQLTTPSSYSIEACACAPKQGGDFGVAEASMACDGHTIGFWRNRHGRALVRQYSILPLLPALCIVNHCGRYVSPSNVRQYRRWMRRARSWNMAYMLSAQLVATHNSVVVGHVHPLCVIDDPCLGVMTVQQLMTEAVASLCANPFTPPCSGPARWQQRKLKNALDRLNNDQIWQ